MCIYTYKPCPNYIVLYMYIGTAATLQANECHGSTETTGESMHSSRVVFVYNHCPPPHTHTQHEVATLEVSAKKQATFFTPYLIPDALSLSTGLHLVKKLLTSEKFIFVIAKSSTSTSSKIVVLIVCTCSH